MKNVFPLQFHGASDLAAREHKQQHFTRKRAAGGLSHNAYIYVLFLQDLSFSAIFGNKYLGNKGPQFLSAVVTDSSQYFYCTTGHYRNE